MKFFLKYFIPVTIIFLCYPNLSFASINYTITNGGQDWDDYGESNWILISTTFQQDDHWITSAIDTTGLPDGYVPTEMSISFYVDQTVNCYCYTMPCLLPDDLNMQVGFYDGNKHENIEIFEPTVGWHTSIVDENLFDYIGATNGYTSVTYKIPDDMMSNEYYCNFSIRAYEYGGNPENYGEYSAQSNIDGYVPESNNLLLITSKTDDNTYFSDNIILYFFMGVKIATRLITLII